MYHQTLQPAELAPAGAILALTTEIAGLASASPFDRELMAALDRTYGKGAWFLYWDEDLAGRPIPGTISLAYGRNQTLVIG